MKRGLTPAHLDRFWSQPSQMHPEDLGHWSNLQNICFSASPCHPCSTCSTCSTPSYLFVSFLRPCEMTFQDPSSRPTVCFVIFGVVVLVYATTQMEMLSFPRFLNANAAASRSCAQVGSFGSNLGYRTWENQVEICLPVALLAVWLRHAIVYSPMFSLSWLVDRLRRTGKVRWPALQLKCVFLQDGKMPENGEKPCSFVDGAELAKILDNAQEATKQLKLPWLKDSDSFLFVLAAKEWNPWHGHYGAAWGMHTWHAGVLSLAGWATQ